MGCPAKERAREVKRAAATAPQTSGLEDSAALAEGAVLTMLQGYTVIVPCPSPNCLPPADADTLCGLNKPLWGMHPELKVQDYTLLYSACF